MCTQPSTLSPSFFFFFFFFSIFSRRRPRRKANRPTSSSRQCIFGCEDVCIYTAFTQTYRHPTGCTAMPPSLGCGPSLVPILSLLAMVPRATRALSWVCVPQVPARSHAGYCTRFALYLRDKTYLCFMNLNVYEPATFGDASTLLAMSGKQPNASVPMHEERHVHHSPTPLVMRVLKG